MHPSQVRLAFEETLERLNLDYLDLYLIHWPVSTPMDVDVDLMDTWRAMEELVDEGLVHSIGVSNFNIAQVDLIADNARIQPVTNQVEVSSFCLNKRLINHCRSRNIVVTGYSPLGAPGREYLTPENRVVIHEPAIIAVANRHRRTPAQILIRYQHQIGTVTIPKSVTRDRIISNFDVFNFDLSYDDIAEIEGIGYVSRVITGEAHRDHPNFPFGDNSCD